MVVGPEGHCEGRSLSRPWDARKGERDTGLCPLRPAVMNAAHDSRFSSALFLSRSLCPAFFARPTSGATGERADAFLSPALCVCTHVARRKPDTPQTVPEANQTHSTRSIVAMNLNRATRPQLVNN